MGIYIKNMEMPTNCWDCPLMNTSPCACKGYATALEHTTNRHPDCPLVPVPPHGRLIDADEAIGHLFIGEQCLYSWDEIEDTIDATETIIPAEEDE